MNRQESTHKLESLENLKVLVIKYQVYCCEDKLQEQSGNIHTFINLNIQYKSHRAKCCILEKFAVNSETLAEMAPIKTNKTFKATERITCPNAGDTGCI